MSSDANLGAASSGLDFQGGTLRVTGTAMQGTPRMITWGAAGGGFDIADAGNTFSVSQTLSGSGGLTKLGAGTLALLSNNDYTGVTRVASGTLQLGDGGSYGSIAGDAIVQAGATLAFNRSGSLTYGGTLSGAGELRKQGLGTLILTGNNTLTGVTRIDRGTLQIGNRGNTGSLTGDIVNNGELLFRRSDNWTYAGSLSGSGATKVLGDSTLTLLGNSSAYTGTLTVYPDSALQVEGKLGGTVETSVRTVLSGTGTLNNVVLTSGMLAPGNAARPMGTMKLRGDLSFGQYASYRVAASPDGQHSSVQVGGKATLAGSVVHVGANGSYAPSTTYTILTADGGVQAASARSPATWPSSTPRWPMTTTAWTWSSRPRKCPPTTAAPARSSSPTPATPATSAPSPARCKACPGQPAVPPRHEPAQRRAGRRSTA